MNEDGQRISALPLFMNLWHVIKSGCLDGEITPCLPTNKQTARSGVQPPYLLFTIFCDVKVKVTA